MPIALEQPLIVFILVLTRVSGLFAFAPIFGAPSIPMRVRAFLAAGIALVLTPTLMGSLIAPPANLAQFAVLISQEALLGIALAVATTVLFSSMQLAGQIISHLGGLSAGDIFDPAVGTNTSVMSQLFYWIAIAVFLSIGGHRMLCEALLDLFDSVPPGYASFDVNMAAALVDILGLSFMTALRAAAPLIVSLLLSMIVLGLISRTLPQLNILAVGFSVNSVVMLVMFMFTIGGAMLVFQQEAQSVIEFAADWLRRSPPSS